MRLSMELQTRVEIRPGSFHIDYASEILMLGSCFAENIGEKLRYFKFNVDVNPFGIVYNPLSVAKVLRLLLTGRLFTKEDLLCHDGKWLSLMHHGCFSSPDPEICLQQINGRLADAAQRLRTMDVLVLTFGTAWVFRNKADGAVVANCHKIPASAFVRSRLEVEDVVEEYRDLIGQLRLANPRLTILFTVSPIRHWKDGAHGNQLSKSVLLLAIDRLVNEMEGVYYFPSYEIVMDELRDYRFYAEDMLHVTAQAVEYIWERFQEVCVEKGTTCLMSRIDKANRALLHRPFEAESEKWQQFHQRALEEMGEIDREIAVLRSSKSQ